MEEIMEKDVEEVNVVELLMNEVIDDPDDGPDRRAKLELLTALIKSGDKQKELETSTVNETIRLETEKKRSFWQTIGTVAAAIIGVLGGFAIEWFRGANNRELSRELMAFEKDGYVITTQSKSILNKQIHG